MNKFQIKLIVVLMAISLAGIILVQYYWIRNAISVKENQFDNAVYNAMGSIVERLDKFHTINFITRKTGYSGKLEIGKQNNYRHQYFLSDSLLQSIKIKAKNYQLNKAPQKIYTTTVTTAKSGNISTSTNASKISRSPAVIQEQELKQVKEFLGITKKPSERINQNGILTIIDSTHQENEIIIHSLNNAYTTLQDIAIEYAFSGDQVIRRLDFEELQPIIDIELNNHKIPLNYEYAVIDLNEDSVFRTKTKGFPISAIDTKYRTNLFPKDIYLKNSFLLLLFPNKTSHIFRSITILFSGSILFTLIILLTFGITIYIILRQKKVSEIKTDFINNMTHEFKTPIATISLAVDSINSPAIISNKDQIKYYTNIIREENQRMNAQVENVLQMSLIDKKDLELNLQMLDLQPLIERAIKNIKLHIAKRNGSLEAELNAVNTNFFVDENHFINVMQNLLENANKYSPESPEIKLSTENTAKGIIIKVSDKGMGMSKETVSKIFDKFYRVPTGNVHNIKGFGLGLSYVKAIVLSFDGNVSVESEPNKGSVFTIFIPYKK